MTCWKCGDYAVRPIEPRTIPICPRCERWGWVERDGQIVQQLQADAQIADYVTNGSGSDPRR